MIDWVEVWDGLHGSRDFRGIVEAGVGLRDAVLTARRLWSEREAEHEERVLALEAERGRALAELDVLNNECASLAEVVRTWHDRVHFEPWLICPHVVCRAAAIEFPAAIPNAALELVKGAS